MAYTMMRCLNCKKEYPSTDADLIKGVFPNYSHRCPHCKVQNINTEAKYRYDRANSK